MATGVVCDLLREQCAIYYDTTTAVVCNLLRGQCVIYYATTTVSKLLLNMLVSL